MLEYLRRWADPQALSQVVGALIGAAIAISLWFAERRRVEEEKKNEELSRARRFRAVLKSGLGRMKNEVESFVLQCRATSIGVETKIVAPGEEHLDCSREVIEMLERFPINIPSSFKISEDHVFWLDHNMLDVVSELKGILQEMFIERRRLKEIANKYDFSHLTESLGAVRDLASKAIGPIEKLQEMLGESEGRLNRGV
ncbi:hypothetical protein [Rhodoplanes azumiensis]|uniref:Uncharacterized protein n=1 Tax=Rhodoplanes azumiensis TaxID=1897628 RepID=A0ABW5AP56_9BRAD